MTLLKRLAVGTVYLAVSGSLLLGQAAAPPAAETKAPSPPPDTVVAEIRGKKLTVADVKAVQKYLLTGATDQQVVDFWKLRRVLADEMRKSGLMDNPEIKTVLDFATTAQLAHLYLAASRMNVKVTEQEVKEYYDKYSDSAEFRQPDVVTVQLIATKEKEPLLAIQKRLMAGEDFDKVMNENKDETLKVTGLSDVVMKEVSAKDLQPSLGFQWQSVMTVQLDKPIGPMKIPTGWAIYKVTHRTPGPLRPFEEVRPSIEDRLLRQKQAEIGKELTTYASKEAGVPLQAPVPTTRPAPARPAPTTPPAGK